MNPVMTMNEYQIATRSTAIYDADTAIEYLLIGAVGELGELCNKYQKVMRDEGRVISEEKRLDFLVEIGDIQWFIVRLIDELEGNAEEVLAMNAAKLASRKKRGTISGSGDER